MQPDGLLPVVRRQRRAERFGDVILEIAAWGDAVQEAAELARGVDRPQAVRAVLVDALPVEIGLHAEGRPETFGRPVGQELSVVTQFEHAVSQLDERDLRVALGRLRQRLEHHQVRHRALDHRAGFALAERFLLVVAEKLHRAPDQLALGHLFPEHAGPAVQRFIVLAAGDEIRVVFERCGKLHLDGGVGVHRLRQRAGARDWLAPPRPSIRRRRRRQRRDVGRRGADVQGLERHR